MFQSDFFNNFEGKITTAISQTSLLPPLGVVKNDQHRKEQVI
jgi:hypothetical protein